ncbi:uncharacterized protein LOC121412824 [Lytechinus variegatus]|uniref:uncharacterized protein LOC121412824 n=1 Tax=Lytechinus variegatus TaxID=7654 RepID=UPI001BB29DCA|nr:uncharacterized protein LOC121412824 [Lytechinus variegatus]
MYEPRILDDDKAIGIILGHADTQVYLNRTKAKSKVSKSPIIRKAQKKPPHCLSRPPILPKSDKMKREILQGPCLRSCFVVSIFFSIVGIALVVAGTVMLTRPRSSSSPSSSGNNHQWMLILGLLTVFVAIACYLCLRNYCVYHLGEAPVKVLSIEGEELKGCQYQVVKNMKNMEDSEKGHTESETAPHLQADETQDMELKEVSDEEESDISTRVGHTTNYVSLTLIEGQRRESVSLPIHSDTECHLDDHLDVGFQIELRRMSKVSQV